VLWEEPYIVIIGHGRECGGEAQTDIVVLSCGDIPAIIVKEDKVEIAGPVQTDRTMQVRWNHRTAGRRYFVRCSRARANSRSVSALFPNGFNAATASDVSCSWISFAASNPTTAG